jgi:phage N-6-adenine-methyltransferase
MIVNTQLANSNGHIQKDLWRTPSKIYNPLHEEFKFTLDPCCLPESALCDKYYTPKENGLIQSWSGEVAFCNPPYSRGNIDKWVEKFYRESREGALVVSLLPVSSSSNWWHKWVWKKASDLRFIKGRIRFVGAPFTAPFSSVLAIY